jgi:hypothetical protein
MCRDVKMAKDVKIRKDMTPKNLSIRRCGCAG